LWCRIFAAAAAAAAETATALGTESAAAPPAAPAAVAGQMRLLRIGAPLKQAVAALRSRIMGARAGLLMQSGRPLQLEALGKERSSWKATPLAARLGLVRAGCVAAAREVNLPASAMQLMKGQHSKRNQHRSRCTQMEEACQAQVAEMRKRKDITLRK